MQHFFDFFGLPLRPLLCEAGVAVTAAGIYYYVNKLSDGERKTTVTEDPVQDQATKPALVQSMESPQVQATERPESPSTGRPEKNSLLLSAELQDSPSEAEEKIQKLVTSNARLEDRVRELEGLLCEARRECEAKATECEQQRQSHSVLQSQYNEMKELFHQNEECLKECERKQEAHNVLLLESDEMKKALTDKEELMKVSLADVQQKYEKDLESITQLEGEKSDLMHQVQRLRASVQEMGDLLAQTHSECDELTKECEQERQAHRVLLSECKEMKVKLKQHEELLMECEIEQEIHSALLFKYDEMKEMMIHKEELLKVSLADAELKYQKALESITQLKGEKSDLMHQVQRLRASVQEMGELLYQTHKECDELKKECERQQQTHSVSCLKSMKR